MHRTIQALALAAVVAASVAGCSPTGPTTGPTAGPALTPAPAPGGWQYEGWTKPSLEVAVPAGWVATTFEGEAVPTPAPAAGPEARAIETAVLDAWRQGGYRVNIGGDIVTPLGEAGPGYIEAFVQSGSWSSLDGFADQWEPVARAFDGKRIGAATLPAGQAVVFEIDDTVDDNPDRMLRARWYLFLLPDGRGMNVAVGTYPDSTAGRAPATMEALRSFADQVIATLRPAAADE